MSEHEGMRGLICHDDVATCRAIGVIMARSGYPDLAVASYASQALPVAQRFRPDAVVVDLAVTGDLGLTAVGAFHDVAPRCLVYVLSPFTGLRSQAREAGAQCLVDPRDLRHLEDWLLLGTDPNHPCR